MSGKRKILIGTFILTITGILSRFIGFFFRMFLSQSFGEEQVGLYQLIFPIYALCFSFTSAGLETAISRSTARKISLGKENEAFQTLYIGLGISIILSIFTLIFLQSYATELSLYVLGDIRCEPMLVAISYAIPFAAIHSCIVGYYFGLRQTKIPALSQLIEQLARVVSVFIIYFFIKKNNGNTSIFLAVIGIIIGECCSSIFCIQHFVTKVQIKRSALQQNFSTLTKELLYLSIPLTGSRILLNVLQSIEAISIPLQLQQYGYSSSEALRNYGVLTGMALPCILFPSAITNSISTMLLPTVAEIQATKSFKSLKELMQKLLYTCLSMGTFCCIIILILSPWIGEHLFHSKLAIDYLRTLAWICPFLYLNSTLLSVTNGLGKANISFLINLLSLSIRISGILIFIPKIGMNGYLWGLLLSQVITFLFCLAYLFRYLKKRV